MARHTYDSFIGGESQSSKRGYEYSFQDSLGAQFRRDAEKLTALRRLEKESSTTVTGLVKWFKEYNGYVFAYDDAGNLYRRNTSNAWSLQRAVSSSAGQGLEVFNSINADALWYARTSALGRATTLTGTVVFDDDYLVTATLNRDIVVRNIPSSFAGTPYSLTTAIDEGATHRQTFTANKVYCRGFQVYVTAKGTSADWTLTLHDSTNVSKGTATVTNANLTNTTYNNFYFSSPIELIPGAEYHYHLTATNITGTPTAGTGTNSDLEDGAFYLIWPSLVSDSYYHPLKEFTNLLCVGNGNFLGTLDDSEVWDPERLIFPKGETVRLLEVVGDYIAIFTWRYNDISKVSTSKMYLWDGVSVTYNNVIPIKDGQVNAVTTYGNIMYLVVGTQGQLAVWNGQITPIRRLNDVGDQKTVEVYPGAICVWDSLIHFGISAGSSTSIPRVVYTYGTQNKDYPQSLAKAYPTSSDSITNIQNKQNNNIQIGAMIGIDSGTFLVGWKNGTTYGIDKISTTKDQNIVYLTTLRFDADAPYLKKQLKTIQITHSPLLNDDAIRVEYRLNNYGSFIEAFISDANEYPGMNSKTFKPAELVQFFEIEFRIIISGHEDLPDLYQLTFEFDAENEIATDSNIVDGLSN